jgi:hypothetical protein
MAAHAKYTHLYAYVHLLYTLKDSNPFHRLLTLHHQKHKPTKQQNITPQHEKVSFINRNLTIYCICFY